MQRESRPSRGQHSITATSRRGAIGHRSELMASISCAPGYGRGRGCTVEMDIPNWLVLHSDLCSGSCAWIQGYGERFCVSLADFCMAVLCVCVLAGCMFG